MKERTKKIIYWVLTVIVALLFIMSAIGKLTAGDQAAEMAKALGGASTLTILGIVELSIAVIWLFPRTGVLGALLLIAYMGGAMAVHLVNNLSIVAPMVIQIVIWLVAMYRFPELTDRLFNRSKNHQNKTI